MIYQKRQKISNDVILFSSLRFEAYIPFFEPSQVAPLVFALRKKEETSSPSSSTIHLVRKIVSNRAGTKLAQVIRPKPGPLGGTRTQSFSSPSPYQPSPGCKRSLPAVHPYLIRPGLGKPQTQPRTSFHMAVLNCNPALKSVTHNQLPNNTVAPSKEHIIERLGAVTRELGKYFPPKKPSVKKSKSGTPKIVQPTLKPEIETTETETNETEVSNFPSPFNLLSISRHD